jgi:hypothetical protein
VLSEQRAGMQIMQHNSNNNKNTPLSTTHSVTHSVNDECASCLLMSNENTANNYLIFLSYHDFSAQKSHSRTLGAIDRETARNCFCLLLLLLEFPSGDASELSTSACSFTRCPRTWLHEKWILMQPDCCIAKALIHHTIQRV